ncbi:L,D-transpeptidase [Enterococcus faecalis]|nr:L,D-transpeptidase [Enterococcus faecalis]
MLLIIFFAGLLILDTRKRTNDRVSENEESVQAVTDTKATSSKELKVLVHPWNKPSEDQYPDIKNPENLTIEVSVEKQRVYIKENQKVIYTMVCSTGDSKAGTPTPTGDFLIEPERGEKFYWEEDNDWAYNWVSFSGHGVYLFHSVLMWNDNEVEEKEAIRLGQEASHGCIRLPLPDSKWLYDNIPTGTPVKIR